MYTFFSIFFLANVNYSTCPLFSQILSGLIIKSATCFFLCNLFFLWHMKSYTACLVDCLESWSAHDIVLELFLMCHYIIVHVLLCVLLRSLLFLKRTRSLTFFIIISDIRYICVSLSVLFSYLISSLLCRVCQREMLWTGTFEMSYWMIDWLISLVVLPG